MNQETNTPKSKRRIKWMILISIVIIISAGGAILYGNLNRLLSDTLNSTFESNIISDVYELKFEKLDVNIFEGSIRVTNVTFRPREKPERDYPYINSSVNLSTAKMMLLNVEIFTFLRTKKLYLERVVIDRPDLQVKVGGREPILFPFKDSTKVETADGKVRKKAIDSFFLKEFQLVDASFHVENSAKQREFNIAGFSISLLNLLLSQQPGRDLFSFKQVKLSIGQFAGNLRKGPIKRVAFNDFTIAIDSLEVNKTVDTLNFHLNDFTAGMKALDVQTADSLFHLEMGSFDFSYKDRSIQLADLSFKPNIGKEEMQRKFAFQHTDVSGTVGSVTLVKVNFDSLIYHRSLIIEEIVVDKPVVSIYKDNTKPVDKNKFPPYFGQQVAAIPIPLMIRKVTITGINLTNVERKRDSTDAKVTITRGSATVTNITNLSKAAPMTFRAEAFLVDKVHFSAQLDFSYQRPEFQLSGRLEKFNLPDLNPVLLAYTPGKIEAGVADEITFSGTVTWKQSTGTMKFLYHDLKVDLELDKKTKWMSSVAAFAANSIVDESNPGSPDLPPRIVKFQAARDMNKGFVNIIIKSVLNGIKETMMMSKENRKAYKESKKQARKDKP